MRRLGLFAVLLSLVGLSTAVAASFDVETEDITSFSTSTSISVPTTPPVVLGPVVYIAGIDDQGVGMLPLTAPANNHVHDASITLGASGVQEEIDPLKFFTWRTVPAPTGGYLLQGEVTLFISQDGSGSDRLTAGLFDCEQAAPIDSSDPTKCVLFSTATAATVTGGGSGFKERTAFFGSVNRTVGAARELRLKIVNQSPASTATWRIQWGFNPARSSQLAIQP